MSTYKAHIFKQRNVGPREEVKLKLFNLDGSPAVFGGGAFDAARMRFNAVGEIDSNMELRIESENDILVYSGEWERVPESAAAEEGQWYVGSIRPRSGFYLMMGYVDFFDNSLQSESVEVTMGIEGASTGRTATIYNQRGFSRLDHRVPFSLPMAIPQETSNYLYLSMATGDTFDGVTLPSVELTAIRLMDL